MASGTYQLVLGCNLDQYEQGDFTPSSYFLFDKINERQITTESNIASNPMQTGDTISDHMYRSPVRYSVSGTFSENSMISSTSYNTEDGQDRLTNIEKTFEYIKNNGILCKLMFLSSDFGNRKLNLRSGSTDIDGDSHSERFISRSNMALKGITWTEKLNTVDFSFSFEEIILINQQDYYNLPEDQRTFYYLPSVTNPDSCSLGDVLIGDDSNNEFFESVIKQLYEDGYIADDFCTYVKEHYNDAEIARYSIVADAALAGLGVLTVVLAKAIVGVVVKVVAALAVKVVTAVVGATIGAAAGTAVTAALVPVGTIVAVAVGIGLVIAGVTKLVSNYKKNQSEAQKASKVNNAVIKLKNGNADEGITKILKLGNTLKEKLNELSGIKILKFSENKDQDCIVKIGGTTRVIRCIKDNATSSESNDIPNATWSFNLCDTSMNTLEDFNTNAPIISSFTEMQDTTKALYNDGSNSVFLVNLSLGLDENDTEDKLNVVKSDLTTYSLWVGEGDMRDRFTDIDNAIADAIAEEVTN